MPPPCGSMCRFVAASSPQRIGRQAAEPPRPEIDVRDVCRARVFVPVPRVFVPVPRNRFVAPENWSPSRRAAKARDQRRDVCRARMSVPPVSTVRKRFVPENWSPSRRAAKARDRRSGRVPCARVRSRRAGSRSARAPENWSPSRRAAKARDHSGPCAVRAFRSVPTNAALPQRLGDRIAEEAHATGVDPTHGKRGVAQAHATEHVPRLMSGLGGLAAWRPILSEHARNGPDGHARQAGTRHGTRTHG